MVEPIYDNIIVNLSDVKDDPLAILRRVKNKLQEEGLDRPTQLEYLEDAISGDLVTLMEVTKAWVTVEE